MALSFVLRPESQNPAPRGHRSVLVTGAAGRIGRKFAEYAARKYDLSLMVRPDHEPPADLGSSGRIVHAELSDLEGLKKVFSGIDTVVHLAGEPDPSATWTALLDANIVGTYQAMVAAKAAGCRRFIYASSIHAVSGYPGDVQVRTSEPVNPGDLYGVTKCFGEALGRYFAEQEGLSVMALRIGAFQPIEAARDGKSVAMMNYFLSHRDLCQLICRCIDDERLQFAIFHAVSDNAFKRLDISDARELVGFQPEDNFVKENPRLSQINFDEVRPANVGDPGQSSGLREEISSN